MNESSASTGSTGATMEDVKATPYTVLVHKEYKKLKSFDINIALLLMCKNEHKRLKVTLDSVTNHVNAFIVFDTGSVDDTLEIIQDHCEEHKINLYLIQGEFVNFAVSRNVSLDYADTIDNISYLLLLDTNDELRGGEALKDTCKQLQEKKNSAFLVCQEWFSAGSYDKYFNTRLVKPRHGWRYKGSVHEYMFSDSNKEGMVKLGDNVVLYQDRTQDDDKSSKRYARDRILLLKDLESNPKDSRTLFYLAQTCSCLGNTEEALKYYTLRSELDDFIEEKFHAFLRGGDLKERLSHDWSDILSWYMKAFEVLPRAEPLVKIAEYYRNKKQFQLAYMFSHYACQLPYPDQAILFIEKKVYDYKRWHCLGIVAYYAERYVEGKEACMKAIEAGMNSELDKSNLKFYEEKLNGARVTNSVFGQASSNVNGSAQQQQTTETKTQFVNRVAIELSKSHPGMNSKQLLSKASRLWKDRNKKQ